MFRIPKILLISAFLFFAVSFSSLASSERDLGSFVSYTAKEASLDIAECPIEAKKICEAFNKIRVHYLHKMTDDELTQTFADAARARFGIRTDAATLPVSSCSPHAEKLCSLFLTLRERTKNRISLAELNDILIGGAVERLTNIFDDPYSRYVPKGKPMYPSDTYVGAGMTFSEHKTTDDKLIVRSVKPGSPAAKAGIARGNLIARINGVSVAGMAVKDATAMIRGSGIAGSKVSVSVEIPCKRIIKTIVLRRSVMKGWGQGSGVVRMMDDGIAYVHLKSFVNFESKVFKNTYSQLAQSHAIKGLIIDFRDNPGGSVLQGVDFLSLFYPGGKTAFYSVDQYGREQNWTTFPGRQIVPSDMRIVALSDVGSASMSEIALGAFKATGRATILGENSYGKGVMQTSYVLKDRSVLYLTIEYTFSPNREKIHKAGIAPDIAYPATADDSCFGDTQLNEALRILRAPK